MLINNNLGANTYFLHSGCKHIVILTLKGFHILKNWLLRICSAVTILLLPSPLVRVTLRILGHKIGKDCRFGFSLVFVDLILMRQNAVIGHFNFISIDCLLMHAKSRLGRMNIINGPLRVVLREKAAIGNSNKILRAGPLKIVTTGCAVVKLGKLTKITSNHHLDCTKSIRIGENSIIAGVGSQIWTHGYIHDSQGLGRYRIDGRVEIGNNVCIGTGCIISMGVRITSGSIVGAGVTVARNLDEPGLYVSAAVRQLPRPCPPDQRVDLARDSEPGLCEPVFFKALDH